MLHTFKIAFFALWLSLLGNVGAVAEPSEARGTRDEAVSTVKAVIAYHQKYGKQATQIEGNKPNSQFNSKDLYVFAYDFNAVSLIHPNPRFIGKNLIDLRDPDGVFINREIVKIATSAAGKGWVQYKWPRYTTKDVESKASYVEAYDGVAYVCGYYGNKP